MKKTQLFFKPLQRTIFHPQWFVFKHKFELIRQITVRINGCILDIGCSDRIIESYLSPDSIYIGLDYLNTATEWYHSKPDVYGDAQKLPFPDRSIDSVLLLDVLEHLPEPLFAIQEISRILRSQGMIVLQVPFLYPLHDIPLDFQRWTHYGLRKLLTENGFIIIKETCLGKSIETSGLLFNIGLCKTFLLSINFKNPATWASLFLLPLIPIINLTCWIISKLSPNDLFMPFAYCIFANKK